jgi:hypothetical protein
VVVVAVTDRAIVQEQARQAIGCETLHEKARARHQRLNASASSDTSYHKCLVLELLRFFKLDFFQWVRAPQCPQHVCTTWQMHTVGADRD